MGLAQPHQQRWVGRIGECHAAPPVAAQIFVAFAQDELTAYNDRTEQLGAALKTDWAECCKDIVYEAGRREAAVTVDLVTLAPIGNGMMRRTMRDYVQPGFQRATRRYDFAIRSPRDKLIFACRDAGRGVETLLLKSDRLLVDRMAGAYVQPSG